MTPNTETAAGSGLVGSAAFFPKWDANKIAGAMNKLGRNLAKLERTDPKLALSIAKTVRELTEGINA